MCIYIWTPTCWVLPPEMQKENLLVPKLHALMGQCRFRTGRLREEIQHLGFDVVWLMPPHTDRMNVFFTWSKNVIKTGRSCHYEMNPPQLAAAFLFTVLCFLCLPPKLQTLALFVTKIPSWHSKGNFTKGNDWGWQVFFSQETTSKLKLKYQPNATIFKSHNSIFYSQSNVECRKYTKCLNRDSWQQHVSKTLSVSMFTTSSSDPL